MLKKNRSQRKASRAKYVKVKNRAYGNKLKGVKIYFEGKKPSGLRSGGAINFGKHILELRSRKYDRFRWIITEETNEITSERGIMRIRISHQTLSTLNKRWYGVGAEMKNDIVGNAFASLFPDHFEKKRLDGLCSWQTVKHSY